MRSLSDIQADGFSGDVSAFRAGDITGPSSATDNSVPRFDLTTGKLLQGSKAIVTDDGSLFIGTAPSAYFGYQRIFLGGAVDGKAGAIGIVNAAGTQVGSIGASYFSPDGLGGSLALSSAGDSCFFGLDIYDNATRIGSYGAPLSFGIINENELGTFTVAGKFMLGGGAPIHNVGSNIIVGPRSAKQKTASGSWTSGTYSHDGTSLTGPGPVPGSYAGNVTASALVSGSAGARVLGLSVNPAASTAVPSGVDYGIHANTGAASQAIAGGAFTGVFGPTVALGDALVIRRVGTTIEYLHNGTLFHTATGVSAASALRLDMAFDALGAELSEIFFGPTSTVALQVHGLVQATAVRFDDGTTQTTASTGAAVSGPASAPRLSLNFTNPVPDSRITASGTGGTRVNAAGAIVAASAPRFAYSPVTLAAQGVSVWEARTNYMHYSMLPNLAAGWGGTAGTLTQASGISPDGTNNAVLFTSQTTGNFGSFALNIANTIPETEGVPSVCSAFVKKVNTRYILIDFFGGTLDYACVFDLDTLTITGTPAGLTAPSAYGIEDYGNGWYRIWVHVASPVASTRFITVLPVNGPSTSYTTVGNAFLWWGNQIELGTTPSPYMITTGAANATRTADVLTMTGANFSDWWNAASNTIVVQARSPASGTRIVWQADDGTANNRVTLWTSGTSVKATIVAGGTTQADLTLGTVAAGASFKAALAFAANDVSASLNGAACVTDSSATIPTVDRCRIGADVAGNYLNEAVEKIEAYASRLPDATLTELTAVPRSGSGVTTVNFGAFPGSSDASVAITGQGGIASGSKVKAWIVATATIDHSADEHWLETIDVIAGNIVPGTGFTIYAKNTGTLSEPVMEQWANTRNAGPGTGINQVRPNLGGGKGTRLYGQYTVAWEWI
jgi:hypothetical protein